MLQSKSLHEGGKNQEGSFWIFGLYFYSEPQNVNLQEMISSCLTQGPIVLLWLFQIMMTQRMKMMMDALKQWKIDKHPARKEVSPLPGTQQASASKAGLVYVSDMSLHSVLGISRSVRSCTHQSSVTFTAAQMRKMLEEAKLKRQVKGNTGNKAKEENS
jgi:hypothetical protein